MIHRRETTLYQAASQISANFRWCLTGTPIQNCLEDIGSLIAFLRVSQLENRAVFRNHIVAPFADDVSSASRQYAALLDALCLKRSRDLLELPDVTEWYHYIDLLDEERKQYDQTLAAMASLIRDKVSRNPERRNQFSIFQAQLQLRLLCNHGTFQRVFQQRSHRDRKAEREDFLHALGTNAEITCSVCGIPIPVFDAVGSASDAFRHACGHKLCQECIAEQSVDVQSGGDGGLFSASCPLCKTNVKRSTTRELQASVSTHTQDDGNAYFNRNGFSSKMKALLGDLAFNPPDTKRYA